MLNSTRQRGVSLALLGLLALSTVTPAEAQQQQQQQQMRRRAGNGAHVATPGPIQQRRRGGNGAGVAAGVLGGLAAGAILGGVFGGPAVAGPGYGPEPAYDPEGVEGPGRAAGCPLVRRPVYDEAGRFAGYQPVPAC